MRAESQTCNHVRREIGMVVNVAFGACDAGIWLPGCPQMFDRAACFLLLQMFATSTDQAQLKAEISLVRTSNKWKHEMRLSTQTTAS